MSAASLDEVIDNQALDSRPVQHRNAEDEARAMRELRAALAGSPRGVLQKLSEVALALCHAHSAGVSLLEKRGDAAQFRWYAVAGEWQRLLWTTLPRDFSPCGTVLDRAGVQLMVEPVRHFTPLAALSPPVAEALLVPFSVRGELVGTVWVIAHDAECRFDAEDRRVLSRLTTFAAAAYERLASMTPADVEELMRMQRGDAEPSNVLPRAPH